MNRYSVNLIKVQWISLLALQEIALIDPLTLPHEAGMPAGSRPSSRLGSTRQSLDQQQAADSEQGGATAAAPGDAPPADRTWPQLPPVATRPRVPAAAEVAGAAGDAPQQCVLLRAGGIISKLDMQEGSEVLLSDAIERFWLPVSPVAADTSAELAGGSAAGSAGVSRTSSFMGLAGGGVPGSLSSSSSMAALGRQSSEMDFSGPTSRLPSEQSEAGGGGGAPGAAGAGQPPHVEMPWWTYGARGMQVGGCPSGG